jgi:predicted nucleic-acid-binding protein
VKRSERAFPDTNVVIRYLLRDNQEQFEAAESFFEEVRSGKKRAVILESVMVECLYILTKFYGIPRGEAAAPLIELLCYKGIVNDDAEILMYALKLFANSRLDPVDCILAVLHKRGEGDIFTFDRDLHNTATAQN